MGKSKTKGLKLPIQMTRQATEVRIAQIEEPAVRFENDQAGVSVHIAYETWRTLGQPGVVIVTTLVPGLVPDGPTDPVEYNRHVHLGLGDGDADSWTS